MARKPRKPRKPRRRYRDIIKYDLGDGHYAKVSGQRRLTSKELFDLSNLIYERARVEYREERTR